VTLRRRRFLGALAAAPVLPLAGCRRRRPPAARGCAVEPRAAADARVFRGDRWATLEAACARIIPSDDEPGATEAGVVNYIDAQLALPHFAAFKGMFLAGLRLLDDLARKQGRPSFLEAPPAVQDRVLRRVERGVRLGRGRNSRRFFRVLLAFTLEGFLGDPVYGGNRGQVGWKLIGFSPRPPRPRCPYTGRA
jgi:gluconate 2-dehydrogenase gamma chain